MATIPPSPSPSPSTPPPADQPDNKNNKVTKFLSRNVRKLGLGKFFPDADKTDTSLRKKLYEYTPEVIAQQNSLDPEKQVVLLDKTVADMKEATTAAQRKEILARDIHSVEALQTLSKRLEPKEFGRMSDEFIDRLCELEAIHHTATILGQCSNPERELDLEEVARALAQHREFSDKAHANIFFNDQVSFIKTRLTMINTPNFKLLCRANCTSPHFFRLDPNVVMQSGADKMLKEAESLGGQELRKARDKAAVLVAKSLKSGEKKEPEVLRNQQFQSDVSKNISHRIEERLLACLDRKSYETLAEEMGIARAKGCYDDITRKTKNFEQLCERLSPLLKKFKQPNADSRQLMKELIGEQSLAADSALLARLPFVIEGTPVTADMSDQAQDTICAATARHLADSLTTRARSLTDNGEFPEADQKKTVMAMVAVLRGVSNKLG